MQKMTKRKKVVLFVLPLKSLLIWKMAKLKKIKEL